MVLTSRITTVATNALKYEDIIVKRMKARQSMAGGDRKSSNAKIGSDQMNISDMKPTTKREELAKIAGVSPTTMQMVTDVYFNVNRTMLLSPHLASVRVKK